MVPIGPLALGIVAGYAAYKYYERSKAGGGKPVAPGTPAKPALPPAPAILPPKTARGATQASTSTPGYVPMQPPQYPGFIGYSAADQTLAVGTIVQFEYAFSGDMNSDGTNKYAAQMLGTITGPENAAGYPVLVSAVVNPGDVGAGPYKTPPELKAGQSAVLPSQVLIAPTAA